MLRPLLKTLIYNGNYKVANRVRGRILTTENGKKILMVEQRAKDIWRDGHRTVHDAQKHGRAAMQVDSELLTRVVKRLNVEIVIIVIEEFARVFVARADDFFDSDMSSTGKDYMERRTRLVPLSRFHCRNLGPNLKKRVRRDIAYA